jgi:hypothetical protein
VVAVAGLDAHGGFGEEDGSSGRRLHLPSYRAAFETFSINLLLAQALTGSARDDARLVLEAIRRGRVFTAIDAIAFPSSLEFTATDGAMTALPGSEIPDNGHDQRFVVRAALPSRASIVLLRNGAPVRETTSNELEYSTREPGGYRAEVRVAAAPGTPAIPWIVSSPIFRFAAASAAPEALPSELLRAISVEEWHLERGGGTTAAFSKSEDAVTLTYRLGTNPSPYAALAVDLPASPDAFSHLVFRGRAVRPMRISAQLRFAADGASRWRKSAYLGAGNAPFDFPISAFRAADRPGAMPSTTRASSVLFVVDTTNARPGEQGSFTIEGVELRR